MGKQAHPTRDGLDQVSEDRAKLYGCIPPARLWVPILVHPSVVNDDIPEEADIDIAVLGLKGRREGGPLVINAKYLQGWQKEAKSEKYPEGRRWKPVVRLVKVMFRYGTVVEEIAWATMVLLPKGKEGYRVIGIVELLWKVFSVVVNCSLKRIIVLHDAIHGFREGRGIGISIFGGQAGTEAGRNCAQSPLTGLPGCT